MGTLYNITVVLPGTQKDVTAEFLQDEVDRELLRVSDQMSTYIKSSEISQFNASTSTDWFPVSAEFATCVDFALQISRATDGAFDITAAPLINAWRFGPDQSIQQIPDAAQIEELKSLVGYQHLEVRHNPPAIRKAIPKLTLDVNALAPGQATDRIVALLQSHGVENCLVDIGGEVRGLGQRAGGGGWRVGIERPDSESGAEIEKVVTLVDRSLATSGDYRKFYIDPVTSKRYSHTIDPRTGAPITHALASVSVITKDCIAADAWATSIMVLGPQAGIAMARKQQLEVFLIERTPDGLKCTSTFDEAGK